MNKHFNYLTQSDEVDFFQKVACDQAAAIHASAAQRFVKTGSAGGGAFEKIAHRLDRDLHMIKMAGATGMGLGMQKRAGQYLDDLLAQHDLTADQFGEIFEKVSSEAIVTDLVSARDHLANGLDTDTAAWLDGELNKLGSELTEMAILEKNAFLRAILGAAKGVGRTVARAGARTAKGVSDMGYNAATKIRDMRLNRGANSLVRTEKKIENAKARIGSLQAANKGGGAREGWHQGRVEGLTAKADKTRAKLKGLNDRQATIDAARTPKPAPNVASNRETVQAPAVNTKAPKPAPNVASSNETIKAPEVSAKTPASSKETGAAGTAEAATDAAPAAAGVTLKGAYENVRNKGWKALSSEEKQKLINAGIATVVGGRVVLGHGVVTGGQGII